MKNSKQFIKIMTQNISLGFCERSKIQCEVATKNLKRGFNIKPVHLVSWSAPQQTVQAMQEYILVLY